MKMDASCLHVSSHLHRQARPAKQEPPPQPQAGASKDAAYVRSTDGLRSVGGGAVNSNDNDKNRSLDCGKGGSHVSTEAIFWLVIMIIFLVVEMVTVSLVSIWFVGGSLAAFVVSFFVDRLWIQVLVFLGVSLILLFLIRPLANRFAVKQKDQIRSGAQALVGKRAIVTEAIDNLRAKGEVQVNGQFWSAKCRNDDEKIEKETVVVIREVDGVRLVVEALKKPD